MTNEKCAVPLHLDNELPAAHASVTPSSTLTDRQQQFVADPAPVVIASAGPGSGKTTVLIERTKFIYPKLHQELGRPPAIALIAYTRRAAAEVRERFRVRAPNLADRVVISTIHRLVLSRIDAAQGLSAGRMFLCGHDREILIRQAMDRAGWTGKNKKRSLAGARRAIEQVASCATPPADESVRLLFDHYCYLLRALGGTDISLVLRDYYLGLCEGSSDLLGFDHILADEVQDFDAIQLAILHHHENAGVQTSRIGDEDQALFDFRHAVGLDALLPSSSSLIEPSMHFLTDNFRCAPAILDPSQRLIANNRSRKPKTMVARSNREGSCGIRAYRTQYDECRDIASRVDELIKYGETVGIMAYTNKVLNKKIAPALELLGIDYQLNSPNEDPFDGPAGTPLRHFALALAKSNPSAVRQHIALALAGIGLLSTPLDSVTLDANRRVTINFRNEASGLSGPAAKALRSFPKVWARWNDLARRDNVNAAIRAISGFIRNRIASRHRRWLHILVDRLCQKDGPLPSRFPPIRDRPVQAGLVQLLTIHAAKGAEFDHAFLLDCRDKTRAFKRRGKVQQPSPDVVEQERRLLYVALSRGKFTSTITWSEEQSRNPLLDELGIDETRP